MTPKQKPLRNREYLDYLRTQRCVLSGMMGDDIDPAHIGTYGRGIKSPDNEALPIKHVLHMAMHNEGEISVLRECAPDDLLRAAFRAYARELYRQWEIENE